MRSDTVVRVKTDGPIMARQNPAPINEVNIKGQLIDIISPVAKAML